MNWPIQLLEVVPSTATDTAGLPRRSPEPIIAGHAAIASCIGRIKVMPCAGLSAGGNCFDGYSLLGAFIQQQQKRAVKIEQWCRFDKAQLAWVWALR